MRWFIPSLLLVFTANAAPACWRPWHSYYGPRYYAPPMVAVQPMWQRPVADCPPPMPAVAPPTVAPPTRMPDKKDLPKNPSTAPAETPYSPIQPATGTSPIEEKIPKVDVPTAPTPRELPKVDPAPLPPPSVTPSTKPEGAKIDVPKIELPPLTLPLPMEKSTSKYFAPPQVKLVPVEGAVPADGVYRINIFNTGDRDVTLTVNGAAINLPKQSRVAANVGRSFRWSVEGGEREDASIPESAAGYEIVIR